MQTASEEARCDDDEEDRQLAVPSVEREEAADREQGSRDVDDRRDQLTVEEDREDESRQEDSEGDDEAADQAPCDAAAAADGAPIDAADVVMNIGLHWGGALYMGQVVTGGRLEVTALGDEVNECARIQQSARDGAGFASKTPLEQLAPEDAGALGLDPDRITYRTVAELDDATEKAVRDAGGIAVATLPAPPEPEKSAA